jgi:arylsulfatase A
MSTALKSFTLFVVLVFALVRADAKTVQPNILVLLADDLGYSDLSCYGSRSTQTPQLDQLAASGMRFTDFYAPAPNCSPSRAGLLTGRSPSRTGMYSYIPANGPHYLPRSEITVAELLRDAGYNTAHMGKWHLCYDMLSKTLPQPIDHGFVYSLGTENNAIPSHRDPTNFVRNGKAVGKIEGYSCQIVADEVIAYLVDKREMDKPFFLCAWFHETHTPIASPPDLIERHGNAVKPKDARYYANVENLDRAVGRILTGLDQQGLTESTFVIFSSDNGGVRPESCAPLRGRKSFVWEGGIREPGIVRWPGHVEPGSVCHQPAGLIDLLPTFCAMAGVNTPEDRPIDGASLLPLFAGRQIKRSTPLFWYFYRTVPAAAMRMGDWVIVGSLESGLPKSHALTAAQMDFLKRAKLRQFELFNLRQDLGQTTDLSKSQPERLLAMKQRMIQLHREVVAEGPRWFQ